MRIARSIQPWRFYVNAFGRNWFVSLTRPVQFIRWRGETPWKRTINDLFYADD